MNTFPRIQPGEIAVTVPVYKPRISGVEQSALQNCARVLAKYDLVIVHPLNLDLSVYKEITPHAQFVSFADRYFKNLAGYNKLLISDSFYRTFSRYQYLLLFQLDAWVFEDSLLEWCRKTSKFGSTVVLVCILSFTHLPPFGRIKWPLLKSLQYMLCDL